MPRSEFPASVRKAARKRAFDNGDLCECGCGGDLTDQSVEYHHDLEAYFDGRPTLENCLAILARCHRRITRERRREVDKVRRLEVKRDNTRRLSKPLPGTHRSGLKHGFDGVWRSRATGRPIGRPRA